MIFGPLIQFSPSLVYRMGNLPNVNFFISHRITVGYKIPNAWGGEQIKKRIFLIS